jgi:hypothetical protein
MPRDIRGTPQWNICIVTSASTLAEYTSIKNSLLYADHTYWISLEVTFKLFRQLGNMLLRAAEAASKRRHFRKMTLQALPPRSHVQFREELQRGGATNFMTQHFDPDETLKLFLSVAKGVKSGLSEDLLHAHIKKTAAKMVLGALTDSRVVVGRSQLIGLNESKEWNAYRGAHELMMSLSRLLLPDVSSLPVDVIMDIRDRLQDSLDPVRAELLRLTEDLRLLIPASEQKENSISAEANNLIATRVEPIVRDASRRANEMLNRKWRRFLAGAAKAFGFAGAGFVDPKLFAKAIQQTLEAGMLSISEEDEDRPNFKATSQFVLHARRLASNA